MDEKGCWDISQRHRVHRDRASGFGKKKKLILAYLASLWFRDFLPLRREDRKGVFCWACAVHGVLCVLAVKRGDRKSEAGKWVVLDTCSCYAYYRNM